MRRELMGEFDAKIWAKEFIKVIKNNPDIIIDEDLMLGWFTNAIMAGYDRGKMSEKVDEVQLYLLLQTKEAEFNILEESLDTERVDKNKYLAQAIAKELKGEK